MRLLLSLTVILTSNLYLFDWSRQFNLVCNNTAAYVLLEERLALHLIQVWVLLRLSTVMFHRVIESLLLFGNDVSRVNIWRRNRLLTIVNEHLDTVTSTSLLSLRADFLNLIERARNLLLRLGSGLVCSKWWCNLRLGVDHAFQGKFSLVWFVVGVVLSLRRFMKLLISLLPAEHFAAILNIWIFNVDIGIVIGHDKSSLHIWGLVQVLLVAKDMLELLDIIFTDSGTFLRCCWIYLLRHVDEETTTIEHHRLIDLLLLIQVYVHLIQILSRLAFIAEKGSTLALNHHLRGWSHLYWIQKLRAAITTAIGLELILKQEDRCLIVL